MRILLLAVTIAASTLCRADEVDSCIQAHMRTLNIPGASVVVVRDGRVIKSQSYGLANAELDVPTTSNTVFEIGSLTKQFTAAAIMMLVEEGTVKLDESISRYLAGVPASWSKIAVRHLLTHSSGIQNYLGLPNFPEIHRTGSTHDEITQLIFNHLQLEFAPGETWSYSNSGYLLLGDIIERLSGKTYWEFLSTRIFEPLGMNSTRSSDPDVIIHYRAAGYEWVKGKLQNRTPLAENAYAAGSILTTALDLAKWDAALYTERLLPKSRLAEMWKPRLLRNDALAPFNYGFGWFIDTYHGRRVFSHGGGTPGFSSAIYRFVDDSLTVILLTNHSDRVIDHIAIEIAGHYLPALARPSRRQVESDKDMSLRLKRALRGLSEGKPDTALFTPAMQLFLKTVTGRGIWQWSMADGMLEAFDFVEEELSGNARILRCRVTLGDIKRWFSFTLTTERQIAQITWW